MKACDWVLFFREGSGTYGYVELYSKGAFQMWSKTLKQCQFHGTEDEVKEEVKKREYEDGLTYRGGPRAAIGHPAYQKRRL